MIHGQSQRFDEVWLSEVRPKRNLIGVVESTEQSERFVLKANPMCWLCLCYDTRWMDGWMIASLTRQELPYVSSLLISISRSLWGTSARQVLFLLFILLISSRNRKCKQLFNLDIWVAQKDCWLELVVCTKLPTRRSSYRLSEVSNAWEVEVRTVRGSKAVEVAQQVPVEMASVDDV